ncbi:MAG TPA: hypothetical protein VEW05_23590, partial [Candidatus Polarisedimenticolia bacterium]|nr:hypothetical protein [Candidatus Polarisedimenticolia bacterium]
SIAACTPVTARVFLRVEPSPLPPADKTGIQDVVLLWPLQDLSVAAKLHSQGYRVFLQCESKDLAAAVVTVDRAAVTGMIVTNTAPSSQSPAAEQLRPYFAAHRSLTFRMSVPGGKQPQIKGRLVVERDGVLQVSSPSSQPWLDTNLALVRLAQSMDPGSLPIIYDFHWDTSGALPDAWHPDAEAYAVSIAEADAIRSDVTIDLPGSLQRALVADDPRAWTLWKAIIPYLDFSSHAPTERMLPVVNLGVIVDDAQASYEAINLMARHNLAFESVRPPGLTLARLSSWNSVVVFCPLNKEAVALLRNFAASGRIVIFVNTHDEFPWHSAPPLRQESRATVYSIGAGQVVEIAGPVVDPENFARDLRRLIGRERSALALWNSLTTLVTGYHEQGRPDVTLYLVNYADQPDNVQVQVKGRFTRVRLESPEEPCCVSLPFVERGGFTEFIIPALRITARVHLDSARESSAAP